MFLSSEVEHSHLFDASIAMTGSAVVTPATAALFVELGGHCLHVACSKHLLLILLSCLTSSSDIHLLCVVGVLFSVCVAM